MATQAGETARRWPQLRRSIAGRVLQAPCFQRRRAAGLQATFGIMLDVGTLPAQRMLHPQSSESEHPGDKCGENVPSGNLCAGTVAGGLERIPRAIMRGPARLTWLSAGQRKSARGRCCGWNIDSSGSPGSCW